jgi:hypothetical protein
LLDLDLELPPKLSWDSNEDDITIFFLLGRGLPIDSNVFLPMTIALFWVYAAEMLKIFF